MEQYDCDESRTLFKIHAEQSPNFHRYCKTLSQQKHVVLQLTAPLQLKCFKVGSKMVIVVSVPVLQNQKKNSVAKSPDSLTLPV